MNKLVVYLLLCISIFCKAQDKKDKHGDIILFNKGIALWDFYDNSLNLEEKISKYDTLINDQKKLKEEAINIKE